MKISKFTVIFFLGILLFIFRIIFYPFAISGGDYSFLSSVQFEYWKNFSFFLWNSNPNLGWSIIPLLSYAPYSMIIGWLGSWTGNNVIFIERLVWWIPFLFIGFISSFLLSRNIFKNVFFSFLASFIYLCNTYILLIIGGGQIAGIGQAYAFAPFVVLSYIILLKNPTLNKAIIAGFAVAISVMFDLRMTYITLVGIGLYILIRLIFKLQDRSSFFKNTSGVVKNLIYIFVIPGVIVLLLHSFWLIPLAIVRQNPLFQLGSAYDTAAAVKFFSFATFENAFGLLHPNWPENIFGKVGFMKPEFLILPILAYSSLLFVIRNKEKQNKEQKQENMYVLYFVLLGLVGSFLAKGANDPFGGVYLWMFSHVPGFIMFRDPTKWYLLIVLSYAMLIPYTVGKIYEMLKRRFP